ncbi:MAG: methylmalonic aciduria and homocystinuria type D protein [Microcoleaceae cyanobacterium]
MIKIEATTVKQLSQEIYLSRPSPFVAQNLADLLPEWSAKTAWTILILQQAQFPLNQCNTTVNREKQRLRDQFLNFSLSVVHALQHQGFCSDIFDPKTGYPVLSRRGSLTHDDVAVAKALLNFPTTSDDCAALIHPQWQTAVYPGVVMTAASAEVSQVILKQRLVFCNKLQTE